MRSKAGLEKTRIREDALVDLELLARGLHASQKTLLERYRQCPEWQQASLILCRALSNRSARRQSTYLMAPPGWLPPMV
jgi:hypothetical protein